MDTIAKVLIVMLFAIPIIIVGVMFVWAAIRDGREDRAVQRRLGIRRRDTARPVAAAVRTSRAN